MKKNIFTLLLVTSLLVTGIFPLTGCNPRQAKLSKSGFYFDTIITVTLYNSNASDYLEGCFKLADKYENYFSTTVADSDIAKINSANGEPVSVHPETLELIKDGIYYCDLSNGAFDITIGSLSDLWDFSENDGIVPDSVAIENALATVDYHNIVINGDMVALSNPDSKIDLGGIAKGYIADSMKSYLNENGITEGIINLGGNVMTIGPKENNEPYTIALQKPFADDGTAIAAVKVTDKSVVSSGVYQRYFYVGDKLYHHLLDTSTGYPVSNNLLGVTIISDKSVDGDGLSTTCFSLGLEKGMELIESMENTEAIFITDDYEFHSTSGIGSDIAFEDLR